MVVLCVENLHVRLKNGPSLVQDVSFTVEAGKTLAIVGESGCGKTMTALALTRLIPMPPMERPTGRVLFQGKNLLEISEKELRRVRGAQIAMVFQDPSSALNPVYSIGDQLMEVLQLHTTLSPEAQRKKVIETLREVEIADAEARLKDYPHQLSGGMRQRIMIAMALLCDPAILIADEPTTALDVTIQAQVLELFRILQKKRGTALILITHDMGVVAEKADDVLVMYAGNVVEKAPVETLFDHPAHPYTQALFQTRRALIGGETVLPTIQGQVPSLHHQPKGCKFHPRCPFVMEKCRHGEVPNCQPSDRQMAKCWLYA